MTSLSAVAIKAIDLCSALESIVSKHRRSHKKRFSLVMTAKRGKFGVADAEYHATVAEMPCTGDWNGTAEVNGPQFRDVVKALLDKETILISKEEKFVVIKGGSSTFTLKRLDPLDKKKTKKKPLPHKGKVEHKPPPENKKAAYNDTWSFSARVPLPKEAYKNRPDDWDKD